MTSTKQSIKMLTELFASCSSLVLELVGGLIYKQSKLYNIIYIIHLNLSYRIAQLLHLIIIPMYSMNSIVFFIVILKWKIITCSNWLKKFHH